MGVFLVLFQQGDSRSSRSSHNAASVESVRVKERWNLINKTVTLEL
jgi:hypothetical protein